jgi:hypothetical protein
MTVDATPGFVGWHRRGRGRAWVRVCEGSTSDECWRNLLASAPPGGDKVVLPADRTPDSPPAGSTFSRHRRGESLRHIPLPEGPGS